MTAQEVAEKSIKVTTELFDTLEKHLQVESRSLNEMVFSIGITRLLVSTHVVHHTQVVCANTYEMERNIRYPEYSLKQLTTALLRHTLKDGSNWALAFNNVSIELPDGYLKQLETSLRIAD